ncbi:hypothetical protein [Pseudoxanthomonas sp. z9]|uniref:hypothetical protein n=1 Tax=Pseudoxanthomonas sp. z9 TaxID=2584942 RepID=UPI0011413887|nr:hypothetical protein [Pseudoxanthomonas sp. z9]
MTDPSPSAAPAPAALAAFLRGVERRAALFAQLQCGDAEHGDAALAAAMRAFVGQAPSQPMADWPRGFWQKMMASPALHRPPAGARWPGAMAHLAALTPEDRQALLSRLAAGLPEDEAVEVLGVDMTRYRAALAAACPTDAVGQPDAAGWRALAEAIQQQMRDLPPERLARLARLREAALRPEAPARFPRPETQASVAPATRAPAVAAGSAGGRWRRWAVIAIVLTCAGGLALTFFDPGGLFGRGGDSLEEAGRAGLGLAEEPDIEQEVLPPAEAAAATVAADQALALHPDLDLLLDPDSETLSNDAAFYAWYLAGTRQPLPAGKAADGAVEAGAQEEGRDTTF